MTAVAQDTEEEKIAPGVEESAQQSQFDASKNDHGRPRDGGAPQPPQPTRSVTGIAWPLVVVSVLSPFFLFALDNTIVADVQPKIVDDLGHIELLPWMSVAFALGAISVNLIWGKMFGQFNTKALFLGGVFLFEVGSAVCGSAPTMNALIVGRAICGVGGSGVYLGCMNILSILTTEQERPAYLSLVGFTWGLGTVLGPIIGGAFADSSATWRWSFYINLCVGGAAAPVLLFILPPHSPRPGVAFGSRIREIDSIGAILIVGAFVTLIMPISFGGVIYTWKSGKEVGMFVCSAVLWLLFGTQQALTIGTNKVRRLFPVEMLKSYELVILFILTAASITSCFLPIYFLPLYFQFVQHDTALRAAVRLLPFVFVLVFMVICNGVVMGKTGYYMPWYLAGGIFVLIGSTLMYTVNLDSSAARVYGYSVLIAFGTGCFSQASFPVAQAIAGPESIAAATAFIGFAQVGGMAIALSVSNGIFLNQVTDKISQALPGLDPTIVRQYISGTGGDFQNLSASQKKIVQIAILNSLRDIYIMVMVAGALAIILSVFMRRVKLFLGPSPGIEDEMDIPNGTSKEEVNTSQAEG